MYVRGVLSNEHPYRDLASARRNWVAVELKARPVNPIRAFNWRHRH